MYAALNIAGLPQIGNMGQVDATALAPHGLIVDAVDPWWGGGQFVYVRANGAIRANGLCVITPVFDTTTQKYFFNATEVPNTANLGRMLGVSQSAMASGNFGWLCIGGMTPVDCTASVAADTTFGIVAAGQGGANSAGKQILNARVMVAAAATVVKANCTTQGLSTLLQVPNSDGWFPGVFLSGTGIAALTRVVTVDPSGRFVTLSVATTASVAGSVTATYNNATIFYNVAHLNRPFAQGAIT